MDSASVPVALRNRLGPEATGGLQQLFDSCRQEWAAEVIERSVERFEHRLTEEVSGLREELREQLSSLRTQMAEGDASVRVEIANTRAELLKWAFLFWIGQVIAIGGFMTVLLRAARLTP